MKINSMWCPKCGKKGMNFYDKNNTRPEKTDDITYLWCHYCEYHIHGTRRIRNTQKVHK